MDKFDTYGVNDCLPKKSGEFEHLLDEIRVRGFSIRQGLLTVEEVTNLNRKLDEVYTTQCNEVGGEDILRTIKDLDIVRCPLAYDRDFLDLAVNPGITNVAREVLGSNVVLLMQNGVINRPDRVQFQTNWHRDLNYQHWVSSKPLAISAFVTLEEFSPETGGTVFLPSSHKFEDFPTQHLIDQSEVQPVAPAGSVLFFDAMTFHRTGINRSNRIRRGINHVIGMPILAQQIDIPAMLGSEEPSDPWLSGYLGYRWRAPGNIAVWRRRKFAQVAP
jgi:ectoine hydroxylase-related dioxygenase (phytanoyl-CoA dioxygenase family)